MKVEVSPGELLDKLSILEIKLSNISDDSKLKNVKLEYKLLKEESVILMKDDRISKSYDKLLQTNKKLWDIEDEIREKERLKEFDSVFIELARNVYITNDLRSEIKREINILCDSKIIEEKSYKPY